MGVEMPKKRINLGAVRGFEAAARRLSFTEAATELNLTQGAVSRKIAALEADLGTPLFKRMTRKIILTEAGQRFYETVTAALDLLDRGVTELSETTASRSVTVSVLPTLGATWLMPRLHKFTLAHPRIEVRVVVSIEPVDFRTSGVDIAIRVGPGPDRVYDPVAPRVDLKMAATWNDVQATELFPDVLVPVLSASVYRAHAAQRPQDLFNLLPLIHTSTRRHGWPDWLRAQGLPVRSSQNAAEFGHFFMGLEEARAGRGIALVPSVVLPDLERRKLKIMKWPEIPSAGEYYVLTRRSQANDPAISTFVEWLLAEATKHRKRMRPLTSS